MPRRDNFQASRPLQRGVPAGKSSCFRILLLSALSLVGCSHPSQHNPNALVVLIESSPTNLDPRYATDAQSQRLDGLLFSSLVARDDQMVLHGELAESWETPDPKTYIFHLRHDVKFHDGTPLTSRDVKFTMDSILNPATRSPKRGGFPMLAATEAPDPFTIIFRLKEPYASFLWSLARPAIGILPAGAAADFAQHPVGSGPFRFVRQSQDNEVVVERNPDYFLGAPAIAQIQFRVVPDGIVRALELRKGSADIEISSLSPDIIPALARQPQLSVTERPGTNFAYLGLNVQDAIVSHPEVRRALAYATDREAIIRYLLHGQAHIAAGSLPPNHWAFEPNTTHYARDAAQAEKLLDDAGFRRQKNGIRLHLILKSSTEEQARLIGAALQEQWAQVGVALELRPLELATLFSDVGKGNFQLAYARWVGANNDPDFFEFAFSSKRFPPDGANRGHYRNPRIDALTDQIRVEMDPEQRKQLCSEVQKILADDLPYIPLWFYDAVSVHRRSLGDLPLSLTGDYDFLAALSADPR